MKNYYYFYNAALLADTVDLGLPSGTLWAKYNLGAKEETDYGDYFMWGSTTTDTNTPCDWIHAPFNGGVNHFDRAYFEVHKPELVNENGKLKPQYDAAHLIMGGDWRMPTKADWDELLEGTTNEWVEDYKGSGVNGRLFTSKANGKTLFFPAAGFRVGSYFYGRGRYGRVWSSLLYTSGPSDAWELYFSSSHCDLYYGNRYCGFSVRGVL